MSCLYPGVVFTQFNIMSLLDGRNCFIGREHSGQSRLSVNTDKASEQVMYNHIMALDIDIRENCCEWGKKKRPLVSDRACIFHLLAEGIAWMNPFFKLHFYLFMCGTGYANNSLGFYWKLNKQIHKKHLALCLTLSTQKIALASCLCSGKEHR